MLDSLERQTCEDRSTAAEYSECGHILLLVGNEAGLNAVHSLEAAKKTAFEQSIRGLCCPEDPPQFSWPE
jgi:hypothetical protein